MWNILRTVKKGEYLYAVVPNHPKRTKNNYVLLHRIICENKMGRMLMDNEIAHHINGSKMDNDPENITAMFVPDHNRLHNSGRKAKYIILKCAWCGKSFERLESRSPERKGSKFPFCSRSCNGKMSAQNLYRSRNGPVF